MKEKKLRRKLRKKAVKLARFAEKHGIDYLDVGAYVRVMPAAYANYDKDGQQYHMTVHLGGEANA